MARIDVELRTLVAAALGRLADSGALPAVDAQAIRVEPARDPRHGDYACNVALQLAPAAGRPPRAIAETLAAALDASPLVERVEVAGPGFLNFHLSGLALARVVGEVLARGDDYGRIEAARPVRVLAEFVSANPTGPLHIGHGRGAAYGAALSALLAFSGHSVEREYYVNDAGRQMDILALSVWLRALELAGVAVTLPDNAYRGDYVRDIARALRAAHGSRFDVDTPPRWPRAEDPERELDAAIAAARERLGEDFMQLQRFALERMLDSIRHDLERFRVTFDRWFSERELLSSGAVERVIERLRAVDALYERDGALWFRAAAWGDEKDRVLVRDNGQPTYFASDIAYHLDKVERGHDLLIDVWGADHHGYVPRLRAALEALGVDPARLEVRLVQFATLYRGRERVQMSTRSGEFVTLAELCDEVGVDAARYFYLMRKPEQHLEFDLELARAQSADNPVYYVQYAHARVASVFRQLEASGAEPWDRERGLAALATLERDELRSLVRRLADFPALIEDAAAVREPHQLTHYLRELANEFHVYYNSRRLLADDLAVRDARLGLASAVAQVIRNALAILGVSAPERM